MAETPSSYKRFAQSDKISQGTTNAALSLNDYLPGQHVTGPNNNDIAATLAQVQAIPIGTATLSGNTYNVTISNYPNTATIYPGQKISVQFNADAPTADDTALNLSAFGQSLPLCARGVRMGQGAIKSGMILELVYRGDMWNADYDVVKANRDANGYTTFADGQSVYNKQSVDNKVNSDLKDFHYKTLKEYSYKNDTNSYQYYRIGKMNMFISEITSTRVNGFQRDSLCHFNNGISSRLRGTAPNREWSCYVGIDSNNYVYIAVSSYSVCTVKLCPYSVEEINPTRYYNTPTLVAVD